MTSIAEETPIYADIIVRRNYIQNLFWEDYDKLADLFAPTLNPQYRKVFNLLLEQHERRDYQRLHQKYAQP